MIKIKLKPQSCNSGVFVLVIVLTEYHICMPSGIIAYVKVNYKIRWKGK